MLLLAACSGGGTNNTPPQNKPPSADDSRFERNPLSPLPELPPRWMWPRDNARVASEQFWGVWQTAQHSTSRMLLSADGLLWHAFGDSTSTTHDRLVELSKFGSKVMFCVEFEDEGKQYRSRPRNVSFGRGAHFKDRELRWTLRREPDQRREIELVGADPASVADDFRLLLLPDDVRLGYAPLPGDARGGKLVLVADGLTIPREGLVCFLQIADRRTDTLDLIKLILDAQ